MGGAAAILEQAAQIADEVLFPAAMAIDGADRVPAGHLDLLASAGLYGMAGPPEQGGLGVGPRTACDIIEILAGGCLATTFVWAQHHRAVRGVAGAPGDHGDRLRAAWLGPLCRGARRAGIALGGGLPGALLLAKQVTGGYRLDGVSPWVTGWDLIDTVYVAARDAQDNVVTALVDADGGEPPAAEPLSAEPLAMVALNASRTVQLRFDGQFVPAGRVTGVIPYREWQARDALTLRINGSLALGVAGRCCRLIGPGPLDDELTARRAALDAASADGSADVMPAARAAAAEFAMRAAATLVVAAGSRAILADQHPQRLAREALFLLVFGSRPTIKEQLIGLLAPARTAARPRRPPARSR
jgi:alkylation response protein AidB-like acyl-CoA dehydrogenase